MPSIPTIVKFPYSAKRNMGKFVYLATAGIGSIAVALGASDANAATLTISPTTVRATDVSSGPSFTVTSDFLGTDTISLNVSGTVNIATGDLPEGYTVNAAGITTQPGRIFGSPVSTGNKTSALVTGGFNYGSLLLGNTTLGFRQLFTANATNGLGSSTPSTNLSLTDVPLSSIFGTGLANNTVLQFRTADVNSADNAGAFTVSGTINSSTTAVPEPFTIVGTLIGGTAAVRMRKKLKSGKA